MANVITFNGNERFPHGSPTLRAFLSDTTADVKLVQGPVESGKSGACMTQIYIWMCTMPRCRDGIRRSRFLIVRPTYGELLTSVIRDFLEWFPEDQYGKFKSTEPYSYKMKFRDVECTVDFVSYADTAPDTLKKLRSTQYTGAWVNEGQFTPLKLWTEIIRRTGRYPSKKMCPDYDRRKRAVLDNNAPLTFDHWILYMRGDSPIPDDMPEDQRIAYEQPPNWAFYVQPPALLEVKNEKGEVVDYKLNPKAENLQNMGEHPYSEWGGMTRDEIDRDFRNITRAERTGAVRYPMFSREKHVAKSPITPNENLPLIIGMDFGTTPACIFSQRHAGRWFTLRELVPDKQLVSWEFAPLVLEAINTHFPFAKETGIVAWGDPSGNWKHETSSPTLNTTFKIFEHFGIKVKMPWKKDKPQLRMETGRRLLTEFPEGDPRVLIDPSCRRLIAALDGGMTMKTVKVAGTEITRFELNKNLHSHAGEAWEYSFCGEGEARETIGLPEDRRRRQGPVKTAGTGDVLAVPSRRKSRGLWQTA